MSKTYRPTGILDATLLVIEKFVSQYQVMESGCWEWQAYKIKGYGSFWIKPRRALAHRVSYELFNGYTEELSTHELDHLCRNRACVNPKHLEPVTTKENVMRGTGISAVNAKKTHCIHGHEFTESNTYVSKRGLRNCNMCFRIRTRRYRAEKRALAAAKDLAKEAA